MSSRNSIFSVQIIIIVLCIHITIWAWPAVHTILQFFILQNQICISLCVSCYPIHILWFYLFVIWRIGIPTHDSLYICLAVWFCIPSQAFKIFHGGCRENSYFLIVCNPLLFTPAVGFSCMEENIIWIGFPMRVIDCVWMRRFWFRCDFLSSFWFWEKSR